ncbi:O-sialoglycoprotein endopeptidase [Desulfitibacter alkalitolerans]|uniref:Kae1-like domain-containing protein n=1 Tax=Desulfitibacter alkalitolerans TaxID=264641 RepID=UPI000AA78C5C|nr:O-sialoglycoprotein endopeptidase [Desulfitibacter alkalitolerans]
MFLGLDTSCYTTSAAVVDKDEGLIWNKSKLLLVPEGEKGLPQSEALFNHLKRLPQLLQDTGQLFCYSQIQAVCASTRPRPQENSYMPVFTVSENIGRILATSLGVPFIETSHQENHLRAGVWSGKIPCKEFLALHVSGGTSELLKVCWQKGRPFKINLLGGTIDLHAGQFIDRVGVSLNLPFPAGPHMERIGRDSDKLLEIPSWVREYSISFSGPEAAAQRLIAAKESPANIARAVENCIAKTLEKLLLNAMGKEKFTNILLVGGVCANTYIKKRLKNRLEHQAVGAKLYFAAPEYSSDNAVGTALIGKDMHI